MIPSERLDELAAMEQAATGGHWNSAIFAQYGDHFVWSGETSICCVGEYPGAGTNAAFIAAARNEFAGMIEQCREANRLREAMKATFEATTFGRVFAIIAEALKGADS